MPGGVKHGGGKGWKGGAGLELFATALGKWDLVRAVGERLGLGSDHKAILAAIEQHFAGDGEDVALRQSADLPSLAAQTCFAKSDHTPDPPSHRNGLPTDFPHPTGTECSPELRVLEVPDGTVALVGRAPVVLPSSRDCVIGDFSSAYAPLRKAYAWDLRQAVADARHVPGTALVLCDDVWPPNYSHWLLDELPRLAFLGSRRDLSLIVSAPTRQFQHDTLRQIGFAPEQVVAVEDFDAVRADRLLATADLSDMPHPAFKGADWALGFLRKTLRCSEPAARSQKLYVSRADASGRRLRNEDALMELLRPLGYQSVRFSKLKAAEQTWAVAKASHVVGLHGADFANLAFAQPGTQVIEIFPERYGTPAYYVVAAALKCHYATYVARSPVDNQSERAQAHDVSLDLDHFAHACRDIL